MAENAEMIVPSTIDPPKRWVGGNDEKKKMANPLETINIDVITGSHMRSLTLCHSAEASVSCFQKRREALTM